MVAVAVVAGGSRNTSPASHLRQLDHAFSDRAAVLFPEDPVGFMQQACAASPSPHPAYQRADAPSFAHTASPTPPPYGDPAASKPRHMAPPPAAARAPSAAYGRQGSTHSTLTSARSGSFGSGMGARSASLSAAAAAATAAFHHAVEEVRSLLQPSGPRTIAGTPLTARLMRRMAAAYVQLHTLSSSGGGGSAAAGAAAAATSGGAAVVAAASAAPRAGTLNRLVLNKAGAAAAGGAAASSDGMLSPRASSAGLAARGASVPAQRAAGGSVPKPGGRPGGGAAGPAVMGPVPHVTAVWVQTQTAICQAALETYQVRVRCSAGSEVPSGTTARA